MTYQVHVTDLEPVTTAHVHRHTTTEEIGNAVSAGFAELYSGVTGAGATPAGPPQAAYPADFKPGDEIGIDLYVPVTGTPPSRGGIDYVTLPGGPAAKTSHRGPYDQVGSAYDALFAWVREHGRTPAGPPRELYLNGPDTVTDPADYLTDVIVPLRAE
ncbi:GyrI-like domain-containing protein [Amycolatopsis sp. NPDC049868]|uniref:GyrI-like domain-containing protein n=1 Tax=Amycolatopsis sp. NPDC049868 TaxID=3363934 RepID=UPI003787F00B